MKTINEEQLELMTEVVYRLFHASSSYKTYYRVKCLSILNKLGYKLTEQNGNEK